MRFKYIFAYCIGLLFLGCNIIHLPNKANSEQNNSLFYPLSVGMTLKEVQKHIQFEEKEFFHYLMDPIQSQLYPAVNAIMNDSIEIILIFNSSDYDWKIRKLSENSTIKAITTYDPRFEKNGIKIGKRIKDILIEFENVKCRKWGSKFVVLENNIELYVGHRNLNYFWIDDEIMSIQQSSPESGSKYDLNDYFLNKTFQEYLLKNSDNQYFDSLIGQSFNDLFPICTYDNECFKLRENINLLDIIEFTPRNQEKHKIKYCFVNKNEKAYLDKNEIQNDYNELILYFIETDDPNYVTNKGVYVGLDLNTAINKGNFLKYEHKGPNYYYYNKNGLCLVIQDNPNGSQDDLIVNAIRKVSKDRYYLANINVKNND